MKFFLSYREMLSLFKLPLHESSTWILSSYYMLSLFFFLTRSLSFFLTLLISFFLSLSFSFSLFASLSLHLSLSFSFCHLITCSRILLFLYSRKYCINFVSKLSHIHRNSFQVPPINAHLSQGDFFFLSHIIAFSCLFVPIFFSIIIIIRFFLSISPSFSLSSFLYSFQIYSFNPWLFFLIFIWDSFLVPDVTPLLIAFYFTLLHLILHSSTCAVFIIYP